MEYNLIIKNAKSSDGEILDKTEQFKNALNPLESRSLALNTAYEWVEYLISQNDEEVDEEEDFTVEVFFNTNKESHLVFGQNYFKVVQGLVAEAEQYKINGLLSDDSLTSIFLNQDEQDRINPTWVHTREEADNSFGGYYEEVFILSEDFDLIF
jgi:hypothetical protein